MSDRQIIKNRRDFFRKTGQMSVLGIITLGTAFLFNEKRVDLDTCGENKLCNNCVKNSSCSLEEAIKFRNNE